MMGFEATTPMVAPFSNTQRPAHWKYCDDLVNAVSFGFVATAILISMFLLLAIFERFLRQRSSEANNVATPIDLERQMHFGGKLENLSPKMTIYGKGVLVLMPGEQIPSFIALPAPAPRRREPMSWLFQVQHNSCFHAPLASRRDYNLTSN